MPRSHRTPTGPRPAGSPFLTRVALREDRVQPDVHPFELPLLWHRRTTAGFFLRMETFFNFASGLEQAGSSFSAYGGASLHEKSHGEAFLALFEHRFEDERAIFNAEPHRCAPATTLSATNMIHRACQLSVQLPGLRTRRLLAAPVTVLLTFICACATSPISSSQTAGETSSARVSPSVQSKSVDWPAYGFDPSGSRFFHASH